MEGYIKISEKDLKIIKHNEDMTFIKYFNIDHIRERFQNAKPFSFVIIDNFLRPEYANMLFKNYPKIDDTWHKYDNPIEKKYAFDDLKNMPYSYQHFFYYLNSENFMKYLRKMVGIENLEFDPYLHGAGIHGMPNDGRLHIHLDYEKHPFSGKERRLNLIYFLNNDWKPEYGGNLEFWDEKVENKIVSIEPSFNRAVFFKTNDISWHGVPDVIKCPENIIRKSIACYWVSDITDGKEHYRPKAKFVKRPWEDDSLNDLYKIRSERRLTKEDLLLL